jgi:hypothetical protein
MEQLTVICATCAETLYECPLCSEWYHRSNVLLSEAAVLCCLLCLPLKRKHSNDVDELMRYYRRNREAGVRVAYDAARELACA